MYTWFEAMHTRVDIVFCNKDENELKKLALLIQEELQRIEKIGNRFDLDSELGRVNRLASVKPLKISQELFNIISECLNYYEITLHCFDITINSDNYKKSLVPDVEIDIVKSEIYFKNKDIKLDLNGYLKGYALDKIKDILKQTDIDDAFLNLGNSSIYARGNQPNGTGWKIGINDNSPVPILCNECLTTSGNETKERKHIKSPETGIFIEGKKSISVITQEGSIGEILSTALFVASKEKREQILKMFPVNCKIL